MEKSIITAKCNKQQWFVFMACFLLWFVLLCCLYTALHTGNNRIVLFANYENSFIFQEPGSHAITSDASESTSLILTTTEDEKNTVRDRKGRVEQADSVPGVDQNLTDELVFKLPSKQIRTKMKPVMDSCLGPYIYVHHLPSRFNKDILKNCSSLVKWFDMCQSISNMGLGPQAVNSHGVLQSSSSWFVTNQFLLEVIFHNRMKQYKCLTNDSSLASAIYVPFYAGLDVGRYLWDFNISVRDSASLDLVKWLAQKPEWNYMSGRDHFFVAGRVTWDFSRQTNNDSDWGNTLMLLPEAKNMTMLIIESSPWSDRDIAIPYPTYFHPSNDIEVFQWQNKVRRQKRPYLFSFVGGPRPNLQDSIRGKIINQCLASRKKCKLLDCSSIANKCDNPVHVMGMFQSSTFCLQPPGDSFTRRSTFDSILAGCIPVFFHKGSAYIQYIWHLPKNYTKYSVFIPENDVKDGKANIGKMLSAISKEEVLAMREEVVRLIPKVIYANPTSTLETLDDAFDIAINGVLDRVEKIRKEMEGGNKSAEL